MGKIIKNGKEYKFGTSVGFQTGGDTIEILTQAEYDELVAAGATDDDIYYFIEDEKNGGVLVNASNVSYDNSESGLVATDVQGAVDEIDGKVDEISTDVTELNKNINKVKTYVGSDGKLHFVDASGADSALPFNSGGFVWMSTIDMYRNTSGSEEKIGGSYNANTDLCTASASQITFKKAGTVTFLASQVWESAGWKCAVKLNGTTKQTLDIGVKGNTIASCSFAVKVNDKLTYTFPNGSGYIAAALICYMT